MTMADKTIPQLPTATRFQNGDLLWVDRPSEAPRDKKVTAETVLGELRYWLNGGVTWTSRACAIYNNWSSVCYGNGLFVAVSYSGTSNRVMTSPDGVTWTSRTSAVDNVWYSICYGNGLFVAVSETGTGNRVMTSPDGITWTSRTSAADNYWRSVCYGNGLFVAVSLSGTDNRVMTSPDGVTWTSQSAVDNNWYSVCYGNGLFVAVSISGTGNRVMTSPDGVTWSIRTSASDNPWTSVCHGNNQFVAVSADGTDNRVMTSSDIVANRVSKDLQVPAGRFLREYGNWVNAGKQWEQPMALGGLDWRGIAYGNGTYVAVNYTGVAKTAIATSRSELHLRTSRRNRHSKQQTKNTAIPQAGRDEPEALI